ncbi:MAG: MurR/RpiR family transcriptional regulator [Pseudomonadota bacterium]
MSEVLNRIKKEYDKLPGQLQEAARFILENPDDVAFLSMREQAQKAEVQPATMVRLAKRLGFSGYDEIRKFHAESMKTAAAHFSGRADDMLEKHGKIGEEGFIGMMAAGLASDVNSLGHPQSLSRFSDAVDMLLKAERVFCVGERGSFPVVYEFHYAQSYFSKKSVLLDMPGSAGIDPLFDAGPNDVLFVVSFNPYGRNTLDAVRIAVEMNCPVLAITDEDLSTIGRKSQTSIIVSKQSSSFFDTFTPAFAAAEILLALLASRMGGKVPKQVSKREENMTRHGLWRRE